ncbi:MAG: ATP-binding protein [Candidatus Aenigmarchaeota archaeon]|nr:ATP-binding protein [Candidatus Aenigmarchaeota archaeon]
MKIVIASGKGGVGKSMLASSLAILFSKYKKVIAVDCDVDAPNLGLWLGITDYEVKERISTSEKAKIVDQSKCDENILEICNFHAIEKREKKYYINPFLCEGCGVCKILYPDAIEITQVENAEIRITKTTYGFYLISAQLFPGESGSGKIVEEIKRRVEKFDYEISILDSPAGIGCPVIASLRGSDFVILVTEPTPSGLSDLKRILKLVEYFKLPFGVVVNRWNINQRLSEKIEEMFKEKFLGKISYDRKVIDCLVNLKPVIFSDSKVVEEIEKIFNMVLSMSSI